MPSSNPDPRTTDNMFVMEVRLSENSQYSQEELQQMISESGIVELDQREI